MNRYKSCVFIEENILFGFDNISPIPAISPCCAILKHGEFPKYLCLDPEEQPEPESVLNTVLEAREKLLFEINKKGTSACNHCIFLKNQEWSRSEYTFSRLHFNHLVACNYKCSYCYKSMEGYKEPKGNNLLSVSPLIKFMLDQKNVISPAAEAWWAGGEPTLNKEFDTITDLLLTRIGKHIVLTNCSKFSKSIENALRLKLMTVECSVDAGNPESYAEIKGRPFWDRVWSTIERYCDTGGDVVLKYIFLEKNVNEHSSFVKKAHKHGVKRVAFDIDLGCNTCGPISYDFFSSRAIEEFIETAHNLHMKVEWRGVGKQTLPEDVRSQTHEVFNRLVNN